MKGVKHYFRDGTEHKGGSHKMPNGETHSGKTHGKTSKKLFHFKNLSATELYSSSSSKESKVSL